MTNLKDLQNLQRNIDLFQEVVREIFINSILKEVSDVELTPDQMKCLRFICCNERVLVGQLARGLRISYPAATKAISRLEEKNIVCRQKDFKDHRNIYVSLTPKGLQIANLIKEEKANRLKQVLSSMTPEEGEAFVEGVSALIKVVLADHKLSKLVCLHCGKDHNENCLLVKDDCFCYL